MKKTYIVIIGAICIIALIAGIFVGYYNAPKKQETSNLNISSAEDLTALIDQIYTGVTIEMPMLATIPVDTTDADSVKSFTGLDSAENLEYAVASEPMMSSQAYSLVLVKVKDGVEANSIAKTMNENINERKWICVTAEKIYTVASGDIVCLVMTNSETAQTVFESFKTIAGSVGQTYERTAEEPEMPEDMMLPGQDGLAY